MISEAAKLNSVQCVKSQVAKRFSKAAVQYNAIADIQARIAQHALARIGSRYFNNALDIGCGTGRHTASLLSSADAVSGVDIAPGMVVTARKNHPDIHFVQGDAEDLPFLPQSFDLAFSSMALQWCHCPRSTLQQIASILTAQGRAELAIMVNGSFEELQSAASTANIALSVNELFSSEQWRSAAKKSGLNLLHCGTQSYVDTHTTITELLRSVKGIGANANTGNPWRHSPQLAAPKALTKGGLLQLELAMHRDHLGKLSNTYKVLHLSLERSRD